MAFAAQWHTPHNRCVRFAPAVAGDHATLATGRPLRPTRTGLSPAGPRQLSWRTSNPVFLCRSGLLRSARNDAERMPSGRIESGSNARLALPESRKLPNAGAAGIDIGGDIDIDQIGLVGGDALANGFAEIAGAIDPHAFDAAGARHGGEVRIVTRAGGRIMEVGGEFAAPEVTALQPADRGVSVVVPDHPDHGQIIFDRRSQHVGMHEERTVAAYRYAGTVGGRELRAHHAGNAEPHRAEAHRTDQRV